MQIDSLRTPAQIHEFAQGSDSWLSLAMGLGLPCPSQHIPEGTGALAEMGDGERARGSSRAELLLAVGHGALLSQIHLTTTNTHMGALAHTGLLLPAPHSGPTHRISG